MKIIAIIGASGHGRVIADIAQKLGYENIMFLDDNSSIKECAGFPVIGNTNHIYGMETDAIVAIGNATIRKRIMSQLLGRNIPVPTLIHPNAVIANDVAIGSGTVVMAGAVINTGARIGKGCIINTCASVDHDCMISDYVHISVGSHLAGTVEVGDSTWIGIGAVVSNNLTITSGCVIGAGATVVKSIQEAGTYIGTPAKKID